MATLQQVEASFLQAHNAGDTSNARTLAAEVRRMRAAASSAPPAAPPVETSQRRASPDRLPPADATAGGAPQSSALGSDWQNFAAGIGKLFVDTGRGIKQLIDVPAQALERTFGGQGVSRALGMPTAAESAAQTQADVDEAQVLDKPLMDTWAGMGGNIAGQALPMTQAAKIPQVVRGVQALAKTSPRLAQYVVPTATGAAIGATQPVASDESRGEKAAWGGVGGAGGQALASGIGAAARGASQRITPELSKLLAAAEARGIPISADQIVNSKPLNALRASLDYIPFSGASKRLDVQQKSFNKALSGTMGQADENVSTGIAKARKQLNAEFDDAFANDIKAGRPMLDKLQAIRTEGKPELEKRFGAIEQQINHLIVSMTPDDKIPARIAYSVKLQLDRHAENRADPTLAHWAQKTRKIVMDSLNDTLGKDKAAAFRQTRQRWGNMEELDAIVKAGADGNVTPASLGGKRDLMPDLEEVRDIGAQFLKGRINDSGTAPRVGYTAGLLGAGGLGVMAGADIATMGGTMLGGATIGRGTNALLNSRAAQNYVSSGSKTARLVKPYTDKALPLAGALSPNAFNQ